MRKLFLFSLLLLGAASLSAQVPVYGNGITYTYNDPGAGTACAAGSQNVQVISTGVLYACSSTGVYTVVGGGGGGGPYLPLAGGGPITGNVTISGPAVNANGYCPTASSLRFALNGTDETSKLLAIWSADQTAGVSDCISIDAGKTLTIGSALTVPNNGGSPPTQVAHRLTGAGQSANGYWTSLPAGASSIAFTGNNSPADLVTLGAGSFEIDHVVLINAATCAPFIFTTNTTVLFHDAAASGSASGSSACNTGIITGGTTTTIGGGTTAAFQGYGTRIEGVFFDKIQTAWLDQVFGNNIWFDHNTISNSSGTTDAYVVIKPTANVANGNHINDNLFETSHAVYGIHFYAAANSNTANGNGFWDAGGSTLGGILFDASSNENQAYFDTQSLTTLPVVIDNSGNNFWCAQTQQTAQNGCALPAPIVVNALGLEAFRATGNNSNPEYEIDASSGGYSWWQSAVGSLGNWTVNFKTAGTSYPLITYKWYDAADVGILAGTNSNNTYTNFDIRNDAASGGNIKILVGSAADLFLGSGNAFADALGNISAKSLRPTSTQTTVSCSTSGSAIFSQPLAGSADKKVLIYLAACLGTASYTYPVAFTNTPSVYASNNVAATVATSVSTTAVTVTGATSTGSLILEAY